MFRKRARENLMQLFYQMDINGDFSHSQKEDFFSHIPDWEEDKNYIDICSNILIIHKEDIDEKIKKASPKWSLNRFSKVDLATLRLAICELCYTDMPVQVAINEAIEMGKKFSNEEETGLIHGILGTVAKEGKEENLYKIEENE